MSSSRTASRSERIPADEAADSDIVVTPTLVGHHRGHMLRFDDEDDTLLPRLSEGIRVLAEILFCQAVDVCIGSLMRDIDDASAYGGVGVWVLRVDDRD